MDHVLHIQGKFKAEIFDYPQMLQLVKDPAFVNSTNKAERKAWISFVAEVETFLGKRKAENYVELSSSKYIIWKSKF